MFQLFWFWSNLSWLMIVILTKSKVDEYRKCKRLLCCVRIAPHVSTRLTNMELNDPNLWFLSSKTNNLPVKGDDFWLDHFLTHPAFQHNFIVSDWISLEHFHLILFQHEWVFIWLSDYFCLKKWQLMRTKVRAVWLTLTDHWRKQRALSRHPNPSFE